MDLFDAELENNFLFFFFCWIPSDVGVSTLSRTHASDPLNSGFIWSEWFRSVLSSWTGSVWSWTRSATWTDLRRRSWSEAKLRPGPSDHVSASRLWKHNKGTFLANAAHDCPSVFLFFFHRMSFRWASASKVRIQSTNICCGFGRWLGMMSTTVTAETRRAAEDTLGGRRQFKELH